jgi:hypothetical protein
MCSDLYHPQVNSNEKLLIHQPDHWRVRLFDLVRRGLIWAGYACLGIAFWIVGRRGTFTLVLWFFGIGVVLQLAQLLPALSEGSSPDDANPPTS